MEKKYIQSEMSEAPKMRVDWKKEYNQDKFIETSTQGSDQISQWIIWLTAMKFMARINLMMIQKSKMRNMFNFRTKEKVARILEKRMLEDQDKVRIVKINKLEEGMT